MRALQFSEFGAPREVLTLAEVPDPQPGPGEVRVRFTHRPINPSDLLTVQGVYPVQPTPPMSPGFEGVGRIDALGAGVTAFTTGQRVISLAASPGTWAERAVLPAARTLAIPDTIDDASAAQLLVNPITAWALVNDALPLSDGAWLLQTAAASALGRIVTTLARRRSVRTLNVVRRREHVAQVLAACGDAVICTADESLSSRVRDIVGADGLGAAIDAVGGALGAEVAACLRPGGTMISLGLLGGTTLGPLDAQALIFNATTVRGFWLVDWFARSAPEVINRAFTEIITMLAMGELRLETEAQYDLADFDRALAHASRPARDGKVMFVG